MIVKFIILIIAYLFIYCAVNVGRRHEDVALIFTKNWWIQVLLITIGGIIINNLNDWFK